MTREYEGKPLRLPDEYTTPYKPEESNLLEKLEKGEAGILDKTSLPICQIPQDYIDFILKPPKFKLCLDREDYLGTWLSRGIPIDILHILCGGRTRWRDSYKNLRPGGEYTFGEFIFKVKPAGFGKNKSFITEIGVYKPGTNIRGRILNFWEWPIDKKEDIMGYLKKVRLAKRLLPLTANYNTFLRSQILADKHVRRAYRQDKENIILQVPSEVTMLCVQGFGIGRFEAFQDGTFTGPNLKKLDITADYGSLFMELQHPGKDYTNWVKYTHKDKECNELDWIFGDNIAYIVASIFETVDKNEEVPPSRVRDTTLGSGTIAFFPTGIHPPKTIGRDQLRRLRYKYGKDWSKYVRIQFMWAGFTKIPYKFGKSLGKILINKVRKLDPRMGKDIDSRLAGNTIGTYYTLFDDGSEEGRYIKKTLPTWFPLFAFTIVDAGLARIGYINDLIPKGGLIQNSIDGALYKGPDLYLPAFPETGPGSIRKKDINLARVYSDHFTDLDRNFWQERLVNDPWRPYLIIPRNPEPTLLKFMGKHGDPSRLFRKYQKARDLWEKGLPPPEKVAYPCGSSKRKTTRKGWGDFGNWEELRKVFSDPDFNFLRDNRPTFPLDTSELKTFTWGKLISDEEAFDILEHISEGGENGGILEES